MSHTFEKELYDGMAEQDVIRLAQKGDEDAFERLYKSHSKHVYSVCMRMLKNAPDAEDLTQQVFLRLFRKIGTFRGQSSFSTWLHRVTVNTVLMHLRRTKKKSAIECSPNSEFTAEDDLRELGPGDTSMLQAIDRLNLARAVRQLPPNAKRYFMLHDVFGFKHREIAKRLSCTIGCSKSQAHKARKRLQRLLLGDTSPMERDAEAVPT